MGRSMKGISSLMIFMVMAYMSGLMVKDMRVIGIETKCMVKVKLFGKMEENMKAIINMTKNMVTESSSGTTAEDTKVTGKMANSTEKVSI